MNSKVRLAPRACFLLCVLQGGFSSVYPQADLGVNTATAATQAILSSHWVAELSAQGVPPERVLGVDGRGVPVLCGIGEATPPGGLPVKGGTASGLPSEARGWETIPSVIRKDGLDSFRLEVNANMAVAAVTLECPPALIPESGDTLQSLRDDGQGQDRVAGDYIWTSVRMRAVPGFRNVTLVDCETNSPPGLAFVALGPVSVTELNGTTNEFLVVPQVGLLDPGVPVAAPVTLAADIQMTPHLVNVRGNSQAAQKHLRALASDLQNVTSAMYAVLPDAFDFLVFFSTDHVEQAPPETSFNFAAGIHTFSKVNYSGTGVLEYDISSFWGSSGRLLGVMVLDAGDRGVSGGVVTHELLHQWACFTDYSLGLNDDTYHYVSRSSAASLLGGTQFIPTNGGFLVNCNESRTGAHYASSLDKYMMGLIDGSAVSPLRIAGSAVSPFGMCGQMISNADMVRTVTMEEIQLAHGIRAPGPETAQRDFTIGFAIESNERLLNAAELTFYDKLAEYYTRPLPADQPAPRIGIGWPPITRFFGEGTTWRSYVPALVEPRLVSCMPGPGSKVVLSGTGFPGAPYTVEGSTDLVNWQTVATVSADPNGVFGYTNITTTAPRQFYRAVWRQ